MPRMQVYLPDALYRRLESRDLPASELLQNAVRADVRRRDPLAESDRYLSELIAEVGEPTVRDGARAAAMARRITTRSRRRAS